MAYIQALLASVRGNLVNALVYIAIVALFIMGLIRCIFPVIHTRNVLRRAIRSIRSSDDATKYAWQEDKFLGSGALLSHWTEYLNNLFFADGAYHNASNVEDFINEETVIYGPGRASFADALPGLLTSLGFLGTLMGLAQGLSGFSLGDSAAVQQSIVTLIPGMRYAFMTSIFGVVGSILFTLITRATYGSTEHTLTAFYSAMARYAGVRSVDPWTQIAIYQQEQTALIQTMAKDLNGTFTENIAEAVHSAVDPLNQSFRGFVNVATKDQMRFMDAVMQRFADRMDESMRGQLTRFSQTLEETSRLQQESCTVVRASLSGVQQSLSDLKKLQALSQQILDGVSAYVSQLNAAGKQTDEAFLRLSSSVEQMELVSRQQNGYLKSISAMQQEITRAMDGLQKASSDLRASAGHIEKVHMQASKELQEELSGTLESYREYVNQFTKRVDYLSTSISGALSRMPEAVSDTSERFLGEMERLTKTLADAQRALDDAVDRLYRR